MRGHRFLAAFSLGLLSACELSFDPSLDGKRCDSEGACVSGYVCSPIGICEREGQRDAASFEDASADASVEALDGGAARDAALVLDAAETQSTVPAATTNEVDSVSDVMQDGGVVVADA
ncbi:MAG TPA: hypothetical protein VMF89_15060, partial [Polyangiales bacterium]|nr:hypothetical protein [Polyangiales bacterium]